MNITDNLIIKIKVKCGIHSAVNAYDPEIEDYINDCIEEMKDSGVLESIIVSESEQVLTAISCYVKAFIGNDRTNTDKYLSLYRNKVFRLSLKEADTIV